MKTIIQKNYKLNKKNCTYGVRLDVHTRFEFLDVKHFKHKTIKFALALFQYLEMDVTNTRNGERGTGNGERGTGNGKRESGN